MLLSLLPLAGWAATGDVVFTPTSATATYDATEHNLPAVSVEGSSDAIVDVAWVKIVGETETALTATEGVFKYKDAATYRVTFKRNVSGSPVYTKDFVVSKKELTITANSFTTSNSKAITYGSAAPENSYTVTGWPTAINTSAKKTAEWNANVSGSVEYTCDYTPKTSGVGEYTITPIVVGEGRLESNNYTFAPATGTLQVVAKTIPADAAGFTVNVPNVEYNATPRVSGTVTVTDTGLNQALTNGTGDGNKFSVTYWVDAACSTTAFVDDSSNHTDAGTYYAKISGVGNYTGSTIKSFKITQKPLAITTLNQQATYNGAVQTLSDGAVTAATVSFDGLEDADIDAGLPKAAAFVDGVSLKLKTKADVKDVEGTASNYTITAYAVKGATKVNDITKIFKNYQVGYFNQGVLTINPKELTFTIEPEQEISIGDDNVLSVGGSYTPTEDHAAYYTISGLASSDAIDTYPTLTVASTASGDGSYAITADLASMTYKVSGSDPKEAVAASNYKFADDVVTTSKLIVNKGYISAKPAAAPQVYGDPQSALSVIASAPNDEAQATAQRVLQSAIVIAETATDGVTKYPNVGTYALTFDFEKIAAADKADYETLTASYNITPFDATYTITKRNLTKITVADQTVKQSADIATALDKDLVTFEVEGGYELTDYDKATLKNEFEYVLKSGTTTGTVATTADAIRIKFADSEFKNFALPAGVSLGADGAKVAGKYLPGKLIVVAGAADIILNPVNKATWTAANDATRKGYGQNAINTANGMSATVKFGDFAMVAERWYTMVLPFATSVEEISRTLGYAVVDVLDTDNSTADAVKFKLHMQDIEAGVPFLVKVYKNLNLGDKNMDGNTDDPITFADKLINKTLNDAQNSDGSVKFKGTYLGYQSAEGAMNEYYMQIGSGTWAQAGYTRPTGAYVVTTSATAPTFYIEEIDGSVTAVKAITAEGIAVEKEGWYTLNGVKLQGAPAEKGIYIRNGKKIVIK